MLANGSSKACPIFVKDLERVDINVILRLKKFHHKLAPIVKDVYVSDIGNILPI